MSASDLASALALRASEVAAALGARDLSEAELPGALGAVGELRRLVDALGASMAGQVNELSIAGDETSFARRLGEKSAADAVAIQARIPLSEARDWCRVGRELRPRVSLLGEVLPLERPVVAAAVTSGTLAVQSAAKLLTALDEVDSFVPAGEGPALEAMLVEKARDMTPRDARRLCRGLLDVFDPDGAEPREDLLRAKSGLWVRQLPDGQTRIEIVTHPEGAGTFLTAVDAKTAPRRHLMFSVDDPEVDEAVRDTRTLAQRRHDAWLAIMRESLTHDSGQVAGTAVTMVVTIGLDQLMTGIGAATIEGIDEPISAGTARRLAAQAEIIPIVLGGPSAPLDVGVAKRLGTTAHRRALAVRDQGCLWPGCNAPPGWCEIAHNLAWALGGRTDLENLALFCPFHHLRFDQDGWSLEWRGAERYLIPPAHVDASRAPRRVGPVTLAA